MVAARPGRALGHVTGHPRLLGPPPLVIDLQADQGSLDGLQRAAVIQRGGAVGQQGSTWSQAAATAIPHREVGVLGDIDRRAGQITLRSKAFRQDGMPFPCDGEALAAHLSQARLAMPMRQGTGATGYEFVLHH